VTAWITDPYDDGVIVRYNDPFGVAELANIYFMTRGFDTPSQNNELSRPDSPFGNDVLGNTNLGNFIREDLSNRYSNGAASVKGPNATLIISVPAVEYTLIHDFLISI
jgi:hypothetical protein